MNARRATRSSPDNRPPACGGTRAYPDRVVAFLVALVPSAGVLFLFWIAIKALIEGDRRERAAQARIEAEQRRGPAQ